ncbi:tetratricopeptide repeat protein [Psychrobacter sp. JB193]|uniref:tetratricopeptide repeat protein n=1 Tax=Psychrobacter sp. JB193 TaxID=2024406 RepID=UPI000BAAD71C|nr:tetratricopeptide repeat protein [Psychrobacter sp. JB193]PAT64042.1 hypothetical protein CIK80_02710 [Psychrobacter sp. JB193]
MRKPKYIRDSLFPSAIENGDLQVSGEHHQLISNNRSKKLIIFFSDTVTKQKQFNFWEVGNKLSAHANILFVKGWCNSWYQDGVRGIGSDLDSTVKNINGWMSKEGVKEVFCTGQSMGGYGALLIGGLLGAKIIAFGAETLLDIPHGQYSRKADRLIAIQHQDLSISFKSGLNAVLLAGEEAANDIYCAQRMLSVPFVNVHTMRYVGHDPAGYLRKRDRLEPLLLDWINGSIFPEMEEFGRALEEKDFPENFYLGWCAIRDKDYPLAITKLKTAVQLYPACDEARRLLGVALNAEKMHLEAFEQFSVASALRFRAQSHLGMANSLRFMGEISQARRAYLKIIKAFPENAPSHYGLGLCYIKLENFEGAASCFKNALKYDPKNTTYSKRLKTTKSIIK